MSVLKERELEKKADKEIQELQKIKVDKEVNLKDVDSAKDVAKKNKVKNLSKKVYKYWVYIFKDGVKVKDFGVNEEEIGDVKLLVRREDIKGESKIVFRELYPEPAFDMKTVQNNQKQIRSELNKLKQIERKLEKEMFESSKKTYNYDITDVRLLIQQKQILLESIQYGIKTRYTFDIRPDGIPALFYEQENSGLTLQKYVKESNLITEASEEKKIASATAKRQIDHQLKKSKDRDWQKVAYAFIGIFLLAVLSYNVWRFSDHNDEQEMQFAKQNLDEIMQKQSKMYEDVIKAIKEGNVKNNELENNILTNNNEILKQCVAPKNSIPTSG